MSPWLLSFTWLTPRSLTPVQEAVQSWLSLWQDCRCLAPTPPAAGASNQEASRLFVAWTLEGDEATGWCLRHPSENMYLKIAHKLKFFFFSQAAVGRTFRCFNFLTTEVDSQVGGSDCFQRMKERRGLVIDTSKVEKGMDSWSVTRQPSHFSRWPCLQGSPCEQFGGGRGWRFSWNG